MEIWRCKILKENKKKKGDKSSIYYMVWTKTIPAERIAWILVWIQWARIMQSIAAASWPIQEFYNFVRLIENQTDVFRRVWLSKCFVRKNIVFPCIDPTNEQHSKANLGWISKVPEFIQHRKDFTWVGWKKTKEKIKRKKGKEGKQTLEWPPPSHGNANVRMRTLCSLLLPQGRTIRFRIKPGFLMSPFVLPAGDALGDHCLSTTADNIASTCTNIKKTFKKNGRR